MLPSQRAKSTQRNPNWVFGDVMQRNHTIGAIAGSTLKRKYPWMQMMDCLRCQRMKRSVTSPQPDQFKHTPQHLHTQTIRILQFFSNSGKIELRTINTALLPRLSYTSQVISGTNEAVEVDCWHSHERERNRL